MTSDDELRLIGIAWRLDDLRWTPSAVLAAIVRRDGNCMSPSVEDEPAWLDESQTDLELAARLCAGCPVRDECLELELRTAGENSLGVWAGLSEDDRRTVYLHWLRRGERVEDGPEGGPRP